MGHMWGQRTPFGSWLSPPPTQVTRLSQQGLYLLSCLAGPKVTLKNKKKKCAWEGEEKKRRPLVFLALVGKCPSLNLSAHGSHLVKPGCKNWVSSVHEKQLTSRQREAVVWDTLSFVSAQVQTSRTLYLSKWPPLLLLHSISQSVKEWEGDISGFRLCLDSPAALPVTASKEPLFCSGVLI